jgi:shikimate dehydrogenase
MSRYPIGATKLLCVVGHPIEQVKGPTTWTQLFEANGVDAVCMPMHVQPENLAAFLAGMRRLENLLGLIITIPHKPAAVDHAEVSERAKRVGSVNVLRKDPNGGWYGDILDGVGFVRGLESRGRTVAGRRCLVVGGGGVGRAIAAALADAGATEVVISDLMTERADEVAGAIRASGTASSVGPARARGFDIVVNASPVGMKAGDGVSIDLDGIDPAAAVADVVVLPEMTPLLQEAQQLGCFVQPGKYMMNNQVASIASFFGIADGDEERWDAAAIERLGDHLHGAVPT